MPLKVLGIKEADAICRQVAEKLLSDSPGERSFEEAAGPTQGAINARTPYKTGHLLSRNDHRMVDPHTIEFTNDASYSRYVHDGTSKMPARPFIRDGLAVMQELFPGLYIEAMNEFIQATIAANRPKEL